MASGMSPSTFRRCCQAQPAGAVPRIVLPLRRQPPRPCLGSVQHAGAASGSSLRHRVLLTRARGLRWSNMAATEIRGPATRVISASNIGRYGASAGPWSCAARAKRERMAAGLSPFCSRAARDSRARAHRRVARPPSKARCAAAKSCRRLEGQRLPRPTALRHRRAAPATRSWRV